MNVGEEWVNVADFFPRIDDEPAITQQHWHCRVENFVCGEECLIHVKTLSNVGNEMVYGLPRAEGCRDQHQVLGYQHHYDTAYREFGSSHNSRIFNLFDLSKKQSCRNSPEIAPFGKSQVVKFKKSPHRKVYPLYGQHFGVSQGEPH